MYASETRPAEVKKLVEIEWVGRRVAADRRPAQAEAADDNPSRFVARSGTGRLGEASVELGLNRMTSEMIEPLRCVSSSIASEKVLESDSRRIVHRYRL